MALLNLRFIDSERLDVSIVAFDSCRLIRDRVLENDVSHPFRSLPWFLFRPFIILFISSYFPSVVYHSFYDIYTVMIYSK
jgi:hypothetical protein